MITVTDNRNVSFIRNREYVF